MKESYTVLAAALALCAVSVAAQAQSRVTLYGLLDMSAGSTKVPGGTAVKGADSGKMTTSYFGLSGSEDLGAGTSAVFAAESFLRPDVGGAGRSGTDAFWARSAYAGLANKDLGTLRLGRLTTPLFVATLSFNAFGDSFGYSPSVRAFFTSGTATGDSGWSDAVQYMSPKMGSFSFGLIGAAGEGVGGRNYGANLGYASGPFAAALVFQKVAKNTSLTAPVDDTKTWQAGGSYDLGVVKLFAQLGQVDNLSTKRDYDIVSVGVAVPVGAGRWLAQYSRIDASTGADRKTFSAGYDHFLSKRTDLYAVVMSDKLTGLSSGLSYSVGVRHRF